MLNEHSFHGLHGRLVEGKWLYADRNFTSTDYYSNTYMMSHFPKYWYFVTIGSRGRGKTFSGKKAAIKWILAQIAACANDPKGVRKFMWWRLTNDAVAKVIENNGSTFFEKQLLERYKIRVNIVNQDILFTGEHDYTLEVKWVDKEEGGKEIMHIRDAAPLLKNGSVVSISEPMYNWIHVGKIASIQEYYKYKGNQLNEYDVIIMDELVRASSERRTFNIPAAFINMVENVCRKRKGIRVMIYANAIGEMQEVKQLFGFMPLPGKFGIYKLPHKRTIIEYLDDSEEWKQEQAQTMAGVLQSSSEFTNVHQNAYEDREDFFIPRKDTAGKTYFASIKVATGLWLDIHTFKGYYYVDTDNYTSKSMVKQTRYALGKDLVTASTIYAPDVIKFVKEMWNMGKFRFSNRMAYDWLFKAMEKYNII